MLNIAISADDVTHYAKFDHASGLWQQQELASELESDLQDTVNWDRKWLVDFNTAKTQLFPFFFFFLHWSCNTGTIDVEIMVLFYRQNFNFLL